MKRFTNPMLFVCAAAALSGSLVAETLNSLQVHIPFDFIAAGRKLPAGDYRISEADGNMVLRISGFGRGNNVMLAVRPGSPHGSTGSSARFEKVGSDRYLSELRMADDRVLEVRRRPLEVSSGVSNAMTGGH